MINICINSHENISPKIESYLTIIQKLLFPLNVSINSPVSALINQHESYDIIILHLDMQDNDNWKIVERIKQQHPNTIWIFTYYGNSSPQAFQLSSFLLNEEMLNQSTFNKVFMRAINQYNALHSTITLQNKNIRYRIKISDIKYVEGYNRHIIYYTEDRKYEAVGKVSDTFDILAPHGFIHVHQGYLVNINYIKIFEKNDVILTDGTKVMISARKRKPALQAFDLFSDLLHHQKIPVTE